MNNKNTLNRRSFLTVNFEIEGWYGDDSSRLRLRTEGHAETKDDKAIDSLSSLSY